MQLRGDRKGRWPVSAVSAQPRRTQRSHTPTHIMACPADQEARECGGEGLVVAPLPGVIRKARNSDEATCQMGSASLACMHERRVACRTLLGMHPSREHTEQAPTSPFTAKVGGGDRAIYGEVFCVTPT